jgi:hypothetical protein
MASLRGLVLLVAQVLLDSTTYFIQTYVFFVTVQLEDERGEELR